MTHDPRDSWLGLRRPNPQARLRLFCFPYAGGSASIYRPWSNDLAPDVEVWPVQLPGRGSRLGEPAFTRLPPLLHALADVLRPHLKRPFAFFGHSMGALIGFELARLLRRDHGVEPVHLIVSGRSAPQLAVEDLPGPELPDDRFLQELRQRYGSPQPELEDPELLELMLPTLRADVAACRHYFYTPEPPLTCPVTAFGGLLDREVDRTRLEAWREQTSSRFAVRMLPGDHFFLLTDRPLFLRALSQELYQQLKDE
jgi:medium-chain acyl-[acyl-carrier-protein] hydrolase